MVVCILGLLVEAVLVVSLEAEKRGEPSEIRFENDWSVHDGNSSFRHDNSFEE